MKRKGVVPSTCALLALAAAAALSVACYEYTGPEPAPNLFLSGSFYRDLSDVPGGGAADTMTLSAIYGHITGYGVQYELGHFYSAFSVTGQYSDTTQSFVLWIRYTESALTTYVTGSVYGADSLSVRVPTYTSPGYDDEVLNRLPVPPCADSAPLLGTYNPAAPGYMVQFRDGVDAAAEAALLADRYGFVVDIVYQAGPKGFAAKLSSATVAVLRCEPAVASIEYDGVVTTNE
jgi:hypothetical protein